jgi:hypothetical protein
MSNDTAIAVGVAKNVFQTGSVRSPGQVKRTERLQRSQFLPLGGHPEPAIDGHLKTGH